MANSLIPVILTLYAGLCIGLRPMADTRSAATGIGGGSYMWGCSKYDQRNQLGARIAYMAMSSK